MRKRSEGDRTGSGGRGSEGRIAGARRRVGLGVLTEMQEDEVDNVGGANGRGNPERTAVCLAMRTASRRLAAAASRSAGHGSGPLTARPRCGLKTDEYFADRDPLAGVVLERMLAGVSTRRSRRTLELVGEQVKLDAGSTSKSAVCRTGTKIPAGLWEPRTAARFRPDPQGVQDGSPARRGRIRRARMTSITAAARRSAAPAPPECAPRAERIKAKSQLDKNFRDTALYDVSRMSRKIESRWLPTEMHE